MENNEKPAHEHHEHKEHHAVHVDSNSENRLIEERKAKVMGFFKNNPSLIFVVVLIALVILGVYIRSLPLSDHGGKPGLWDITTNDYTLGPDLDPFLFLRYAKEMITGGSIPRMDNSRFVPLGFDTTTELQMVSYMIVLTYRIVNMFGSYSANFAGAFMPVWIFAFTTIFFFLFVREIFIRKDEKETELKANLIATISTLFMVVIPEFLSRTLAGIPEKESVGFCFMFLAFYLFLKTWKTEKLIPASILGILAGVATALMGLTWGGVTYIYVTIGLASFIALVLDKLELKESIAYCLWLLSALIVTFTFTNRFNLSAFITGLDTGIASLTFAVILIHNLLWRTKFSTILRLDNLKIPKSIISLIISLILGVILVSLVFGPGFILDKIQAINRTLLQPVQGRWATTVAENRQPYLSEWLGSFGASFFWMFLIGSVFLFKNMLGKAKIENKKAWILTAVYSFFLFGLLFSRYAPHPAMFDGEGILSKSLYYGSALLLAGFFIYFYIKDYREKNESEIKNLQYEYIFLFVLLVLCLFTARSAIRLIMVLAPIAPIFLGYLLVEPAMGFRKLGKEEKDQTAKILLAIVIGVVLILSAISFTGFYKTIKTQSYNSVPYYYTLQWQEAMSWVRDNTPTTAVFAHWWDYGYWVQSIGNRATVTDGSNVIVWWNYLTGRYVLTGDNQKDSLDFLYAHNATHLLIDSSDIGKYGAFSQIGSDANYDRLSQGPISFISDSRQIQETKDGLLRIYNNPAGNGQVSMAPLEEDLIYETNGTKTTFFKENSAVIGVSVSYIEENQSLLFKQPQLMIYSQGNQVTVPMRYMYYNNQIKDFKTGINATAYPIQRVYNPGNGQMQIDNMGAMIYLSPRIMRGFLGQVYILNNALGNFPNFKLAYSQPDYILDSFNKQGGNLREFTYYEGIRGPIKIWAINYTGKETFNPAYVVREVPSDITWKF